MQINRHIFRTHLIHFFLCEGGHRDVNVDDAERLALLVLLDQILVAAVLQGQVKVGQPGEEELGSSLDNRLNWVKIKKGSPYPFGEKKRTPPPLRPIEKNRAVVQIHRAARRFPFFNVTCSSPAWLD
jgi:hypothetical protein